MIFDRSWYNRAGVERGDGVLHSGGDRAIPRTGAVGEKAMVDSGILLLKYWLEVSADEQTRRLESRINDPRKIWKLSDHGLEVLRPLVRLLAGQGRHVRRHRHAWAPWYVAHTDNKMRGRLNIISHLISQIPYDSPKREPVVLPDRQGSGDYQGALVPVPARPEPVLTSALQIAVAPVGTRISEPTQ